MGKEEAGDYVGHCIAIAFPAQGHITPLLQFSKRLGQKRVRVTLVLTTFFSKTIPLKDLASNNNITLETISDGFDQGGYKEAGDYEVYMNTFRRVGSRGLSELVRRLASSGLAVDCIVYDSYIPWILDVAKGLGVLGASFLTQPCAVDTAYFHAYKKWMKLPLEEDEGKHGISLPALPLLAPSDLPSFLYKYDSYPFFRDRSLEQFSNIDQADWVLVNSFYELEQEVVQWMKKIWPLKTVGPTVPSMFLDKRIENDTHYGISMFKPNDEACMKWLNGKPKRSVVYVSFGSLADLSEYQMEEMAWGLKESECYFLWVVRASEESKLPKDIKEIMSDKGIIVTWCPQLQVLSHEAVGCFVTHCGWNSTLEALCLGVPMVGFPQWADQNTNAKLIMDVWKVGITAKVDEKDCFTRQEVKECVKEIMESERGKEMKKNVMYWKNMARNAIDEGGSSDKNIDEFVAGLVRRHK
ncbi:UDP-glycosyltransferase 74G1-like [Senna tora]|uniref:Glycosyltransferase n=1 Tax=Senna tora TaxID=362788 RepID=A0A834XJP0_9FABA|nr:UDP-glycosyltransferase 74G1-like [Senna tora]KAF7845125.1 UDP-glycosyltransferase 74G1-like [Senna tora]